MIKYRINSEGAVTKYQNKLDVNEIYEISLDLGKLAIPFGCIPLKTEYAENDKGFVMTTFLSNMGCTKMFYDQMIVMEKENAHFRISSPYNDMLSVANEIAIALLQISNVITIHSAAAYKMNGQELVLFCGESNSGKSTTMEKLCTYKNYSPIADDHIHLKFEEGKIFFSVPIWDDYNSGDKILTWKNVSKVDVISIGEKNQITKWIDIMKYIVGMGMFQQFSLDVINELIHIERNFQDKVSIREGYYQNAKKTIEIVLER